MKNQLMLTSLVVLVMVIASLSAVHSVTANPLTAPAMSIIYPMPVTYQNSSVPLFFGANVLTDSPAVTSLSYSLDGNQNITITALGKTGIQHFDSQTGYTYHINSTLTLDNLANGNHTLWVYSHDTIGNEMSGSIQFSVDVPSETPTEPVPNSSLLLALIIIASILAVSISVLLYRRHQNRYSTLLSSIVSYCAIC